MFFGNFFLHLRIDQLFRTNEKKLFLDRINVQDLDVNQKEIVDGF